MTIKYSQAVTGVGPSPGATSGGVELAENEPNPFRRVTTIRFSVPGRAPRGMTLTVYDAAGRAVETLVDGRLNPGPHSIDWDALAHGSGAYFYRLEGEGFSQTRKMMLVK